MTPLLEAHIGARASAGARCSRARQRVVAAARGNPTRAVCAAVCCALVVTVAPTARAAADTDSAASAPRRGNVLTLRKKPPTSAPDHAGAVAGFVRLAASGDADAVFRAFDEVPVRANGDTAIRQFVAGEVIPFFLDAVRLDASMRVTAATLEDGTEGHMAYGYVVTTAGQARPFVLAWRTGDGPLRVMDLQLGRCVKARHPVAPGRCER